MTAGLASATLGLAAPSHALTLQSGFAGDYAPDNWTFDANGRDGSVDTTAAPSSITLRGNNDGGVDTYTNYTTTATADGEVKFDWAYSSNENGPWDSFGYILNVNGVYNQLAQLANNDSQGIGTSAFNVLSGNTFGFYVFSIDGSFGPGIATISNFSAPIPTPAPVPGPLPILGVGAAFAYSRRLRRRINLAKSSVVSDSVVVEQM